MFYSNQIAVSSMHYSYFAPWLNTWPDPQLVMTSWSKQAIASSEVPSEKVGNCSGPCGGSCGAKHPAHFREGLKTVLRIVSEKRGCTSECRPASPFLL